MKRANELNRKFDCPIFYLWLNSRFTKEDYINPTENKIESYGLLNNEIVSIDYA